MRNYGQKGNGTAALRVVCAVVFCLFTFCYLYFYQADILYAEQHLLSGGKTTYDRTIGAVLITVVLLALQIGVFSLTRIAKSAHFITYVPSFLVLTILTDYSPDADGTFSFGSWPWIAIIVLIVLAVIVFIVRQIQTIEPVGSTGLFSRIMWINMLGITVMAFLTGALSNGDDVFHYRMKMEMCLVRGQYNEALQVGKHATATDESLTMLRAYTLAHENKLGDQLFQYSLAGGSSALQPRGSHVCTILFDDRYIKNMARRRKATDYKLCASLLDGDLEAFAKLITEHYDTDSAQIPRHYREALILYTRTRTNPIVAYHDEILDTDYKDFITLERQHADNAIERAAAVSDVYHGTYWHYYRYVLQKQ